MGQAYWILMCGVYFRIAVHDQAHSLGLFVQKMFGALVISLSLGGFIPAAFPDGGHPIPRDAWPASWFEDPKTASDLGIVEYDEAPDFAELVARGELPPVHARLPDDPVVVEPYSEPGIYGGQARTAGWLEYYFNPLEAAFRMCPEGVRVRYNLIREIEASEDLTTYTLHLRPGMKWSDGHPHTAEDYVFWFEHVYMNRELTPLGFAPFFEDTTVIQLDRYAVQYRLARPYAYFRQELSHPSPQMNVVIPAHHARHYHPAFRDADALREEARAKGFVGWTAYFDAAALKGFHGKETYDLPVLRAYRLTARRAQYFIYEANPYYFKIDPAGQQLPYIRQIVRTDGGSREMIVAQASSGVLTLSCFPFRSSDIPFLLRNEERGNYRTYLWRNYLAADTLLSFNQTYPDPAVREILTDVRFRRALSLAVNRDEVNDIIYFGQAVPRQMMALPTSKFYDPEMARAYTAFDPAEAKRLLDEMGLVDRTGDGMRNRRDGSNLNIIIETAADPETMELVLEQWREVGLSFHLRPTALGLKRQRGRANQLQMVAWYGDRVGDTLFPIDPRYFVPTVMSGEMTSWGLWARWFLSEGESGIEPPGDVKDLMTWWQEMRSSPDRDRRIELGKRIMQSQTENLWTIGITGLSPKPMVVSNRLRNVPEQGYWGWDTKLILPYHPESFYLLPETP